MKNKDYSQGEIWIATLDPVIGREQRGKRPVCVVSDNGLNHSKAELLWVIPLTSQQKNIPTHVLIPQQESLLKKDSYAKCEDMRSISTKRLIKQCGQVSPSTLQQMQQIVQRLLGL